MLLAVQAIRFVASQAEHCYFVTVSIAMTGVACVGLSAFVGFPFLVIDLYQHTIALLVSTSQRLMLPSLTLSHHTQELHQEPA
jgi:hypothetical protein